MAVPEFVLRLREKIGTDALWLSGITAVILDDSSENILLIRRSDTGEWAPVTGIIDPGEQPAVAAAREAREEADVVIRVERLAGVNVTAPVVYPNGDLAQYVDIIFLCRHLSGDPRPADGEALEAAWFPLDALPAMTEDFLERIRHARTPGNAFFSIADAPRSW
ncbi:MAG: NUDIX domain-containing protein [Pseudolysinimonas sp.]